jgi:phosphoglycerol transferase MdoB-like AlkP superfamily enzyme
MKKNLIYSALRVYHVMIIAFAVLIMLVDLELFRQWGSKINAQFFLYLKSPKEAFASSASSPLVPLLLSGVITCVVFGLLAKRLFKFLKTASLPYLDWKFYPILIAVIGINFVAIRGGLSTIPNNQSSAFYTSSAKLNNAALNSVWNSFYYLFNSADLKYSQFQFFEETELAKFDEIIHDKYESTIDSVSIDSAEKPNVVLVILESWTADVVNCITGKNELSENFDRLAEEGLLFTNCYSSGMRTDKGIAAIISGFPSQSDASVITYPEKSRKLPSVVRDFSKKGYSSLFIYGGDAAFANMKIYVQYAGFEEVKDIEHFDPEQRNSKWGTHDGEVFDNAVEWFNQLKKPFLGTVLTLSSHEPFEVPMEDAIKEQDYNSRFKNSVIYTDRMLGEFMEKCAEQDWYDNTLFLFVADHGKEMGMDYKLDFHPGLYKIPLLAYGPYLTDSLKGKLIDNQISQTDIPELLLDLCNMQTDQEYPFSLSPLKANNRDFVSYTYYNGIASVKGDTVTYYDNTRKESESFLMTDNARVGAESLSKKNMLYEQLLMKHFFDLSDYTQEN